MLPGSAQEFAFKIEEIRSRKADRGTGVLRVAVAWGNRGGVEGRSAGRGREGTGSLAQASVRVDINLKK